MNYSATSIANLALGRIGARGNITSLNENSPDAKKVLNVWDAIFQEVLSERDWKFAKTRVQLQLSTVTPVYNWQYAWVMPTDFLRFVRPRRRQPFGNEYYWGWGPEGSGWYSTVDAPFAVPGPNSLCFYGERDYKVEAIQTSTDGSGNAIYTQCALTNYGGCFGPVAITYIRLITDYTQLLPGFVNCLAYRLAAELAVPITEDKQKFEQMTQSYRDSLNSAEAQNETMDFERDEAGSESWVRAGRCVGWYYGGYWG